MRLRGMAALIVLLPALGGPMGPLHPGDRLPRLAGPTLPGPWLELPAVPGRIVLVIFTFSRSAGKDARMWNERFFKDFPDEGPAYLVLELESVPKFIRSMVVSGIRKDLPLPMQGRAIILDHDEAAWKGLLQVSGTQRAQLVLLDSEGRVAWRNRAAFTEVEYSEMKAVLGR